MEEPVLPGAALELGSRTQCYTTHGRRQHRRDPEGHFVATSFSGSLSWDKFSWDRKTRGNHGMREGSLGVTCQYERWRLWSAIHRLKYSLQIMASRPLLFILLSVYSLLTHSGASAPIDVDALPPPRPENLASGALFGQKYSHHDATSSSYT